MKIIAFEKRNASKRVALAPVLSPSASHPCHDDVARLPDGPAVRARGSVVGCWFSIRSRYMLALLAIYSSKASNSFIYVHAKLSGTTYRINDTVLHEEWIFKVKR
jgi:hypothetical protein